MKLPRRSRRPLFILPALAALLGCQSASAAFVVYEGTGLFAPSFRGGPQSTYFGWATGSWDGNPPPAPGDPDPNNPDTIAGTPSINPGGLPGPLLTQGSSIDIVSGSNNIYSDVSTITNLANLQLTIPTSGTVGSEGFTTIIIQGFGLSGAAFMFSGALDGFGFGDINGIAPEYLITKNANGAGQWWAKWELPGNQSSYTVNIVGQEGSIGGSVLSVTNMSVDTFFSNSGYASDAAIVPEPSSALLSLLGAAALLRRRRR